MKAVKRIVMMSMTVWLLNVASYAQNKIDEQRMKRDIEVAENVLTTLLKQQFDKRNFFPLELNGTYTAGYGVTFNLPSGFNDPMRLFLLAPDAPDAPYPPDFEWDEGPGNSFSYSFHQEDKDCEDCEKMRVERRNIERTKAPRASKMTNDSLQSSYVDKFATAAKDFLVDYGDLLSQLSPEEKIMITNHNDGNDSWYRPFNSNNETFITIEAVKGDLSQAKQGKISREQLLSKIRVTKSQLSDKLEPDLELLSSIFNRLYQPDLAKTFFTEGSIHYERLNDFGVIYHMKAFSSRQDDSELYSMPTLALSDLDQEKRDKKVKELYPAFESELKENMLDYGRTLKSLKNEESLVFNVKITRCKGCGIPSTLELSIKSSALRDFNSGKITKEAALGKFISKKGPDQ